MLQNKMQRLTIKQTDGLVIGNYIVALAIDFFLDQKVKDKIWTES